MRRVIVSLTLTAMLAGCSHVRSPDPMSSRGALDEVNRAVRGRTVDIRLSDGTVLWAENVRVAADSTWFAVVGQPSHSRVWLSEMGRGLPTSEIDAISVRHHGRGAIEGAAVGLLTGLLTGVILAARDAWISVSGGGTVMGGIGLAACLSWGAIGGSKDVYDLRNVLRVQ